MLFRLFSSFLTAGNKSKCGTLQRLTDPQQSTDEPIFRPMSPPKRQAMQGKPIVLSPISTQTSSHLRTHGTFALLAPTPPAAAPIRPLLPRRPDTPLPPQSRMQFPNRSDSATRTDTNMQCAQGELHAKLLSCTTVPGMPHPEPPHGLRGNKVWLRRPWAAAGPGQARARPIGGRHGACGAIGV